LEDDVTCRKNLYINTVFGAEHTHSQDKSRESGVNQLGEEGYRLVMKRTLFGFPLCGEYCLTVPKTQTAKVMLN
jgi:hypothetical protein